MSKEQLEVVEELELEIESCSDPEEKEELERTLSVCREFAYALTEGIVEAVETPDGEKVFHSVA